MSSYSKTINQSALFSIMGFINVPSILSAAVGWNQVLEKAEEWMSWRLSSPPSSSLAFGKSGQISPPLPQPTTLALPWITTSNSKNKEQNLHFHWALDGQHPQAHGGVLGVVLCKARSSSLILVGPFQLWIVCGLWFYGGKSWAGDMLGNPLPSCRSEESVCFGWVFSWNPSPQAHGP